MERPQSTSIPLTSGVYIYKDSQGVIIYVGKARCLRKRVLSYFRPPEQLTAKTRAMIARAASIDMISTGTEKEALLLEASLIKKHRPHYNIILRDDKQYVMFRIGHESPYPRLEIVRKSSRDNARYFGPFTSGLSAREAWKAIHKAFPLRRCSDSALSHRTRPCLYHDIGLCLAPCTKDVDKHLYADMVHQVEMLLSGQSKKLLSELHSAMHAASDALEFERAAMLRDQIKAVRETVEKQNVVLESGGDMDIVNIAETPEGLGLGLLFVRAGRLVDGRNFFWNGLKHEDAPELLWSFLFQFYSNAEGRIPPRVIIPQLDDESSSESLNEVERTSAQTFLSDIQCEEIKVRTPHGSAEQALLEMAGSNAREAARKSSGNLPERIASLFRRTTPVNSIICVDVSHTGGTSTRVGVVAFTDGKPDKTSYRTYTIENAHGDDHIALAEWAKRYALRRLPSSNPPLEAVQTSDTPPEGWPDMLLIDGGRGQVATVAHAFEQAGVDKQGNQEFPFILAGIAKARDEFGHTDRRAGNISDRIFPVGRTNPLPLKDGSPELLFFQRVRDEAHRFAIGRHREARSRLALRSTLLSVRGIGQATARRLWDAFGSLEAIASASQEDIARVQGIGTKQAEKLFYALKETLSSH